MISTEGPESEGDQPCFRLEPLKTHLPGKAGDSHFLFGDLDTPSTVTANGVQDIEDRILRITGYYGYFPGYSSHRSKSWK